MNIKTRNIWDNANCAELGEVLANTSDIATMRKFLTDLLTEKEITEISVRLRAAQMLCNGAKYDAVISETKLSSRTVARISKWLKSGSGGYTDVLKTIPHTQPVRAD